jgi:hypothetical protein
MKCEYHADGESGQSDDPAGGIFGFWAFGYGLVDFEGRLAKLSSQKVSAYVIPVGTDGPYLVLVFAQVHVTVEKARTSLAG